MPSGLIPFRKEVGEQRLFYYLYLIEKTYEWRFPKGSMCDLFKVLTSSKWGTGPESQGHPTMMGPVPLLSSFQIFFAFVRSWSRRLWTQSVIPTPRSLLCSLVLLIGTLFSICGTAWVWLHAKPFQGHHGCRVRTVRHPRQLSRASALSRADSA